MATDDNAEFYFIYENRLASFHGPQPVAKARRGSAAHSRAPKALTWPHKNLHAAELAKAGFYYYPTPSNPDNVACFLCQKSMDGWEEDDDPLAEHLKHSPECGWAIAAAVEAEYGGYAREDPRDPLMLEARKATFAGRWPYEGKKGWKCKTKQLAEAGWKYTPTLDSDDNTTCTYCQLALDGWEAGDKPMDEHYKRSPDCPFFALINQYPAPPKKGRSKAARSSKASRLSMQSVATVTSEMPSFVDMPADHDDSVMTTTSVATQGGKKAGKGRKAATAGKGRKTRAKKDEAVEIAEDDQHEIEAAHPPAKKATRGKKRTSDEMEDSVLTTAEAPAPKKRATRTRGSHAVDASIMTVDSQPDTEMTEADPPAKKTAGRKKGRTSNTRSTRKGSVLSIASTASTASLRGHVPDDDELERQLEADLERPLTDDEDILADSDSERKKAQPAAKGRGHKAEPPARTESHDFAMFDPAPVQADDAAVDAELEALENEMKVEAELPTLKVTKKGRKAGTRKASKQTKKAKAAAQPAEEPVPAADAVVEPVAEPQPVREAIEEQDISVASSHTVVKGESGARTSTGKRGRGRPKKSSSSSATATEDQAPAVVEPDEPQPTAMLAETESATITESFSAAKSSPKIERKPVPAPSPARPQHNKALPLPPTSQLHLFPAPPPATPRANHISPAPSAKQATVSPSPSPQASDAENQPPSSKPSASGGAATKRVILAPLPVATPLRGAPASPSKRANVIGGLRSAVPWTAADLDLVFGSREEEGDENADPAGAAGRFFGKGGELSSPEGRMTVEEWVYHNAGRAEAKLRHECEAMVTAFEREGGRAMRVLEGVVVE
ncbi:Protein bir1 [Pleurostoma richardsiae]|uniref:Protein bir1 n=1 Tax=Pleurostoma richardsiae TaxID=41990 RepID=A0AA38S4Y2_9PEZI|nr:Protein bir1 [Pleurostoma richardsiae]